MDGSFDGNIESDLLARALGDESPGLKQLYEDDPRAAADVAWPIYEFVLDSEAQRRVMRRYVQLLRELTEQE